MPITPRFKLSQTSTHLTIVIHIPHIRVSVSTIETLVEGADFHFHSSPYLLFLSFPGKLLDDAETCREAKAIYDPSDQNGVLTVVVWKEDEGIWKDLDLLGNLVNRSGNVASGMPKERIQVLSSHENVTAKDDEEGVASFSEDITSVLRPHYGFLDKDHSVFTAYAREGLSHDMLEIPQPDETTSDERRNLRLDTEQSKFDPDRYLGDLFLSSDENDEDADMIFVSACSMEPHWVSSTSVEDLTIKMEKLGTTDNHSSTSTSASHEFFNEDENLRLMENKAQIPPLSTISKEQTESLFLSLLDILYAYTYDHRTTFGDATCESSWTIVMLSPTLSWLESYITPYDTIVDVLRWSIRRCMIYPYLRNFHFLSKTLVKDVVNILSGGVRVVLRCLLQIQKILDASEFHYLFNKLYINSYISWIQMVGCDALVDFAKRVTKCLEDDRILAKAAFGLDLDVHEKNTFEESESHRSDCDSESSDESSTSSASNVSEAEIAAGVENVGSTVILDDEIGNGSIFNISKSSNDKKDDDDLKRTDRISTNDGSRKKVLISEI